MTGDNQSKLNRKNAGFSLVELLVAITILAIIVIPLLNSFLSSHKLNVKSRQTLRATTVAQDIMEGLKAYNLEELKTQFNDPSEGFYVIDDSMIKGEIKEETAMEVDEHGNPCDGLYYFSMSKVTMQGTEYDALIKVDARGYMEGGTHTQKQTNVGADGNPQAHNNDKVAHVGNVNNDKGASINRDGLYDDQYVQPDGKTLTEKEVVVKNIWNDAEFNEAFEAAGIEEDEFAIDMPNMSVSRTYIIEIEDSGDKDEEGNVIANAKITTEYECTYNRPSGYVQKNIYGRNDYLCGRYSSGNFYLFYYPWYELNDDMIIVKNVNDLPLCMTIAKQIDTDAGMTDAQLMVAEIIYKVVVDFQNCSVDNLKVRTNLGTSLVNSNYLTAEGKDTEVPGQVKFWLNGGTPSPSQKLNIYDLSGVRNTKLGAPGTDDKVTEMIYDVEVTIYQEGAAAEGFKDEDKKITIEGSKNN